MLNRSKVFILICLFLIIVLSGTFIKTYNFVAKDRFFSSNEQPPEKKNEERIVKLPQDDTPPQTVDQKPQVVSECLPASYKFIWEAIEDNELIKNFRRNYNIIFSPPQSYSNIEGITTFRGNNYRDSASYGNVSAIEQKLEKAWSIKIGLIDSWTGVGWNGQPAIVKWDSEVRAIMNMVPAKRKKDDLKEVIYAALDGKIYFLDLDDGTATRSPINVGAPLKGSVTVDPRGVPLLYSGQGIDEVGGKRVQIGYRIYSLIDQKMLYFINGFDKYALRRWGAFDSAGLVDKKTDSLVVCGENGIVYTLKLNTRFDPSKRSISIRPEETRYRYYSPKKGTLGMENSVAVYRDRAFFADNSGTLQCVDLNTLSPVWIRDVTDDTDSTIALEEDDENNLFLYTANEIDKKVYKDSGYSYIRKINAHTGELIWEKSYKGIYDSHTNGGILASPVVGKNDISGLVIFNLSKIDGKNTGKLVALDKQSGKEVWTVNLKNYSWSSPVDVYDKSGKSYLIVCDSGGNMFLFEGKSGKILHSINLGANIEGSPAVYGDMIVVGTRGQKIWGIKIK